MTPCLDWIVFTKFDASNKASWVPVSNQAIPLPKLTTFKLFSFKYISLRVVISNSPLLEGLTFLAFSTTVLS